MDASASSDEVDWAARSDRIAAGYLGLQALLGVALWITIWSSPAVRSAFEIVEGESEVTNAFAFADLGGIVVASALTAWAVRTRRSWAVLAAGVTVGAVLYPTLFLVGWVVLTDDDTFALATMVPVSFLTCWAAWNVWRVRR
jgi:hypothetical protein